MTISRLWSASSLLSVVAGGATTIAANIEIRLKAYIHRRFGLGRWKYLPLHGDTISVNRPWRFTIDADVEPGPHLVGRGLQE